MGVRLYSIEHLPAHLPIWELIREDLGDPPAARIARALELGVSTVHRYNSTGYAPKIAAEAGVRQGFRTWCLPLAGVVVGRVAGGAL
jgi:hypothetical protein